MGRLLLVDDVVSRWGIPIAVANARDNGDSDWRGPQLQPPGERGGTSLVLAGATDA